MGSRITRRARQAIGVVRRRVRRDRTRWAFAIGEDRIVAVELARTLRGPRPARVLRRALDPPGDHDWPSLDAALGSLPTSSPARGDGDAFVALLRPLARVKVIDLPPVRADDARALIRRNASRYFAFLADDAIADVHRYGSRRGPAVAVCAAGPPVRLAAERLRAAGFRVREMAAAPVALVEAARAWLSGAKRGRAAIVARSGGGIELLLLDRGVPSIFYPVPAGPAADAAADIGTVLRDAGRARAVDRVVLVGEDPEREELRAALEAGGVEGLSEGRSGPGGFDGFDADVIAAAGATRMPEAGPSLLPRELRRRRDRRVRRRSAALATATAVLLALAALAHLWGLGRELDAVRVRRDAIAAGVRDALESRRTVDGVRDRLAAIAGLERERPRWTALVAELARALPDSAHLRSFAATDSTVRIGGSATSVAVVVRALEAAPAFGSAALAAPVRREARDGRERFELTLRRTDASPGTPGPPARSAAGPETVRP